MTSEERRWVRRRATTSQGREIALALPTGATLEPGSIVAIEPDWYLEIEAAPEAVLAIRPRGLDPNRFRDW
jgi:urease accessory protein UreE